MKKLSDNLGRHIQQKALQLDQLTRALRISLPQDCHEHLQVAGIRDNQLIILTDSPVWQTRLRMLSQNLLEAVHQYAGIRLSRVRFRLSPARRAIQEDPPAHRQLSPQSSQLIEQTARCISDPELQAALLRLSRKAKKP